MEPKPVSAQRSLTRAVEEGVMSPGDADLCACFLSESRALRGLSLPRVNLYASTLSRCRRFLDTDFDQATVDDLYGAVAAEVSQARREITPELVRQMIREEMGREETPPMTGPQ